MFHNKINTSLFLETAKFMKSSGLLAAGYDLITLGGIGYANGSTWNSSEHGWGPLGPGNITRNASGYLQVDPVRFPGGNEGMRKLTDEIRAMGFRWGSYTEAGTTGCNGAIGSSEGFEEQDAALFFDEWQSEYLMVDSCGVETRPPPHGPPPGYIGGQARWEMSNWKEMIVAKQAAGHKPIILHDCHNGCGSGFGGPTLSALACNKTDPAQQWAVAIDGRKSQLIDRAHGLCVGCPDGPAGGCANDALTFINGSGSGLGLSACAVSSYQNGDLSRPAQADASGGMGASQQLWVYSKENGTLAQLNQGAADGACLGLVHGTGPQVGQISPDQPNGCGNVSAAWDAVGECASDGSAECVLQIKSRAEPTLCLSSAGGDVAAPIDEWVSTGHESTPFDFDRMLS
jgi:hypothetical protein